jgi:Tfp pilus assembly protein PilO
MPYDLKFTGNYFQIADFLERVDGLVHTRGSRVEVRGRLLTVDAFSLQPLQSAAGNVGPVPKLTAEFAVTTYLTPADQGITAGATPTGPPAVTSTSSASTTTSSAPVPGAAGSTTTSP